MQQKGFRQDTVQLVKFFLTNRTLSFSFNNRTETSKPFEGGLPQGSPLSPILFLIYIQSMLEETQPEKGTISYMDDDALSAMGKNFRQTVNTLTEKANTRIKKGQTINMEYEASKTALLHFYHPSKSPKDL